MSEARIDRILELIRTLESAQKQVQETGSGNTSKEPEAAPLERRPACQ